MLTIVMLCASFRESKPERTVLNPFTGVEVVFEAKPGGLDVKAYETSRLNDLLTTKFGKPDEQSNTATQNSTVEPRKVKKKSKAAARKKRASR